MNNTDKFKSVGELEFENNIEPVVTIKCFGCGGGLYVPLSSRVTDKPLCFRFEKGSKKQFARLETFDGEFVCYAQKVADKYPRLYHGQSVRIRTKGERF